MVVCHLNTDKVAVPHSALGAVIHWGLAVHISFDAIGTCDVTYSLITGVYLTFTSMNNVCSQDTFWFPHSGWWPSFTFSLTPIPITERGCCVPLVKSICLISKQNISPIQKTCNHHSRCTRKLPGSSILCCGCWLWRPSPCLVPSTISPTSNICHCHSHTHWCHPWTSDVDNSLWSMGRRKLSILWIVTSWTPSSTSQSWQCNSNNERSPNTSTMTFTCLFSSHTSFHLWQPVPVCCLWIPSIISQVRKVPHCQTWPVRQKQDPIHTMMEDCQPLPKWLWNGSDWLAEDVDHPLLYKRR